MIVDLGQAGMSRQAVIYQAIDNALGMLSPGFGLTREQVTHEALDKTLRAYRLVITPSGPAWNLSASFFETLTRYALDEANRIGAEYGYRFTPVEIADAIIERGYKASEPPPFYQTPAVSPTPTPAIHSPTPTPPIHSPVPPYEPPPVQSQLVYIPRPAVTLYTTYATPTPTYTTPTPSYPSPTPSYPSPTPTYPTPTPARLPAPEPGLDKNTILLIIGAVVGGLALGSVTRRRR